MNEARFWVSLNQAPPMLLLLCPTTSFPFKVTQSALIFFSNFDIRTFQRKSHPIFLEEQFRNMREILHRNVHVGGGVTWRAFKSRWRLTHSSWRTRASEQVLNVENPNDISTSATDWTLQRTLGMETAEENSWDFSQCVNTALCFYLSTVCIWPLIKTQPFECASLSNFPCITYSNSDASVKFGTKALRAALLWKKGVRHSKNSRWRPFSRWPPFRSRHSLMCRGRCCLMEYHHTTGAEGVTSLLWNSWRAPGFSAS